MSSCRFTCGKKFAASLIFVLLLNGGLPHSVFARETGKESTVSRAQFLEEAVGALFGTVTEQYTVPFTGVPMDAEQAAGLANSLDALHGWERGGWNLPVTRGEALEVLLTLGGLSPRATGMSAFRDVREEQASIAAQALSWHLLAPLTERYFGWSRVIQSSELQRMLDALSSHLALPLDPPVAVIRSHVPPPDAGHTRVITPPSTNRTQKKSISVGFSIDRGARGIPREELPRNDLLSSLWGLVQSRYLYFDTVDQEEVGYALAEKLMSLLGNPYTTFFRPSSAQSFQQQLQGELSGIGAQVETHPEGGLLVVSPLAGSPAITAGIRPGDRITQVDGLSVIGLSLNDAVEKIRGPVGTMVSLTLVRNGATLSFKVVRAKITIPEIEVNLQDDVVVIHLFQFGEHTIRDLGGLLTDVLVKKPVGVILDLRNNPGGLLDAAIAVLEHFFPRGTVVAQIKTREDVQNEITRGQQIVPDELPVVVIVNGGSASASEIVAGAFQDLKRALILGVKTFGKGTVQEVVQFATGESAKLTTGEWFTPHGRSIEKTGIMPDVSMPEAAPGSRDEMLLEALRIVKAKVRGGR